MSAEMAIIDWVPHGQIIPVADSASAQGVGPLGLVKTITGAAPPTVLSVSGGGIDLALTATSEAQNVCLSMGDILSLEANRLAWLEAWIKVSASLASDVIASVGVCSARADDLTGATRFALFQCNADNNLDVETDDNVTDLGPKDTGLSVAATRWTKVGMYFRESLNTRSAPSLSKGSFYDVIFRAENAKGLYQRVCPSTLFDLSGFAGNNLQFLAQIQKTSGTSTGTLSIGRIRYAYEMGDYAA